MAVESVPLRHEDVESLARQLSAQTLSWDQLHEELKLRGLSKLGPRLKAANAVLAHLVVITTQTSPATPKPSPPASQTARPRNAELAHFRALLRGEINPLYLPETLSAGASEGPSDDAARLVRSTLLDDRQGLHKTVGGSPPLVGIAQDAVDARVWRWTSALRECGDPKCSLNRLARNRPRQESPRGRFCALVVESMAHSVRLAVTQTPVRYVSVGAGKALFDFELLAAMQHRGLQIECVALVDTAYGEFNVDLAAPRQLARFFAPANVYVFSSLRALMLNAEKEPVLFGRFNTYVHCDASDISEADSRAAADACLAPDGMGFELQNSEMPRASSWRRGDPIGRCESVAYY